MSVTEVGYSHSAALTEGNRYYNYLHMKGATWWLRSRYTTASTTTWYIIDRGNVYDVTTSTSNTLAPIIRLG